MLTLAFHTLHIFKLLAQLPQAFVRQSFVPIKTTLRVYRRYIRFEPGHTEEDIEILKSRNLEIHESGHLEIQENGNPELWNPKKSTK